VLVTNIDSYQGQEKNIVIISLVRSNIENTFGFSEDHNRLNVAISRCKDFLLFFCSKPMLQNAKSKCVKDLNILLEKYGAYTTKVGAKAFVVPTIKK